MKDKPNEESKQIQQIYQIDPIYTMLQVFKFTELEEDDICKKIFINSQFLSETEQKEKVLESKVEEFFKNKIKQNSGNDSFESISKSSLEIIFNDNKKFIELFLLILQEFDEQDSTDISMHNFLIIIKQLIEKHSEQFLNWLLESGYDLNFQQCYDIDFGQALEKQLELQKILSKAPGFDNDLIRYINRKCELLGHSSLCIFPSRQVTLPTELDYTEFPNLKYIENLPEITIDQIRLRFSFIQKFNDVLQQVLPFVDLRRHHCISSMGYTICREGNDYVFTRVKSDFFQNVLDATAEPIEGRKPTIRMNRMKMVQKETSGKLDFSTESNFGAGFQQLFLVDPFLLRPPRPQGADPFVAFELDLIGQFVEGAAGPYRQYYNDAGNELQKENSLLLYPCPNKLSGAVNLPNNDRYIVKPSSNNTIHLNMFEFLGMLFGICLRTGVRMPLNLSSFVWKPLVGEKLTKHDLNMIDDMTYKVLKGILECDRESFEKEIQESFATTLSDRTEVELKPNGRNIIVTFETREEYVSLVYEARLNEHNLQIEAIRRGINKIIPITCLNLFTWRELEILICGNTQVDIDLLRRHTSYSKGVDPNAQYIQWFWDILTELSQENRRKFIKFAWAQERLPADDDEFVRTHTRLLVKPVIRASSNIDLMLPKADTCFFNLELPSYSSKEIMRQRLLFAITETLSMNADEPTLDEHLDNPEEEYE